MAKLINKINGQVVSVKATCKHPESHYGHAVWVDKQNVAYCEVEMPNPVYVVQPADTEDIRIQMGARIAELRKENGLTQSQLAFAAGLKQHHISRIEQGSYSVGLDTLQKIAEVFGRNVDLI